MHITYLGQFFPLSRYNPVPICWANCWWDGRRDWWGLPLKIFQCWTWLDLPCTCTLLRDGMKVYTRITWGQICIHRWGEDFECTAVQWHWCRNIGRQDPESGISCGKQTEECFMNTSKFTSSFLAAKARNSSPVWRELVYWGLRIDKILYELRQMSDFLDSIAVVMENVKYFSGYETTQVCQRFWGTCCFHCFKDKSRKFTSSFLGAKARNSSPMWRELVYWGLRIDKILYELSQMSDFLDSIAVVMENVKYFPGYETT